MGPSLSENITHERELRPYSATASEGTFCNDQENSMNGNLFVFRPGGIPGGIVFNDWLSLMSAMSEVEGRKMLEFDDSVTTPCNIPPGKWPMKDVMWAGFGPRPGVPRTAVAILSGAEFTDLRMIGGQITILNQATDSAPSPVSDFSPNRDHVQIGLRDDCGNPQLVNPGKVPMFNLGSNSALFFIQNCLFGMPTSSSSMSNPLIRHCGPSQLTLNLLGQNQTGPNVVLSEAGASVLFGALSSSAQVAVEQTTITGSGGSYSFGPQGRIQRLVIPRPPAAPATTSQDFNTPNVLIRCDGTSAFTQDLPGIATGFGIAGNLSVPLYTGGQEVVVAEVAGGSKLKVRATSGNTIDGSGEPVRIGKHGSRTFVSDGISNWITISEVHHAE
jgi:hypothetical protein